jgi:hypothetical protein
MNLRWDLLDFFRNIAFRWKNFNAEKYGAVEPTLFPQIIKH